MSTANNFILVLDRCVNSFNGFVQLEHAAFLAGIQVAPLFFVKIKTG
jgi:hypothetical protein